MTISTTFLTDYINFLGGIQQGGEELRALECDIGFDRLVRQGVISATVAEIEARTNDAPTNAGIYIVQNVSTLKAANRDCWGFLGESKDGDKRASGKQHIVCRRSFYIDCDPKRVGLGGERLDSRTTNASEAELALAEEVAKKVVGLLTSILGSSASIGIIHSGNGVQVHVALDFLPVSNDLDNLIEEILESLGNKFDTDVVSIDRGVGGRERMAPLPGSWKRKGPHSEERPHRMVTFEGPATVVRLSLEDVKRLHKALLSESPLTDDQATKRAARRDRLERLSKNTTESDETIDSIFKQVKAGVPIVKVHEVLGIGEMKNGVFVPRCSSCGKAYTDGKTGFTFQEKKNRSWCYFDSCSGDELRTVIDVVMEAKGCTDLQAAKFLVDVANKEGIVLPPIVKPFFALNEIGNADRLVHAYGDDIRFVGFDSKGYWRNWDGHRWTEGDLFVQRKAQNLLRALWNSPTPAIAEHAEKSSTSRGVSAMISLARSSEKVQTREEDWDANTNLFNAANGTLENGVLREANKNDLITMRSPINYNPSAKAPKWESFLDKVFCGDKELIHYVHKYVGYMLTGSTEEQTTHFLMGRGSNGKSQFADVVMGILGDYQAQTNPDLLLQKNNSSHPTEKMTMRNKYAVFCSEPDDNKAMSEATVKVLCGDDPINARKMRRDEVVFKMTAKVNVLCNTFPRVPGGGGDALWRRIVIIPFNATFNSGSSTSGEQGVKRIGEKLLAEEAEGILAWAVEGLKLWKKEGLELPQVLHEEVKKYREEEDTLARFIDECCIPQPGAKTKSSDLYNAYVEWCRNTHEKFTVEKVTFGKRLSKKGFVSAKSNGLAVWNGLSLRSPNNRGPVDNTLKAIEETQRSEELDNIVEQQMNSIPGIVRAPQQ